MSYQNGPDPASTDDFPYATAGGIGLEAVASFEERVKRYLEILKQVAPDRIALLETEILLELEGELQRVAPPYTNFGVRYEDIGLGFWPDLSSLRSDVEEGFLLQVSDLSKVPDSYEGFVLHVSDHGKFSLYSATKRSLRGERDFRVWWELL